MENLEKNILKDLESLVDDYQRNIKNYKEKIKNPEKFFNELSTWGGLSARSPLRKKAKINFLLNYIKSKQIDVKTHYLKKQEERLKLLDKELEKIKQQEGYIKKLLKELTDLVAAYERAIKYKELMFSDGNEFTNDLDGRDICEILIKELEEKKDITKLKKRVEKTDKILQKHAQKLFRRFYGFYEDREWDYYPKSYWWRHLKEFVEEQGEKK